jgi:putative ABC transport system substrate-binding protein
MRRREFMTLVAASALVRPFAARAQQSGMPVIGWLHSGTASEQSERLAALRQGLR